MAEMAEPGQRQVRVRNQDFPVDVIDGVAERRQQDGETTAVVNVVLQELCNNEVLRREVNGENAMNLPHRDVGNEPYRGLNEEQIRECTDMGRFMAARCDLFDVEHGAEIDERVSRCDIVLNNQAQAVEAFRAVLGGLFEGGITMTKVGNVLLFGYKLARKLSGNTITAAMPFVANTLVRFINTAQVYRAANGIMQSIGDWIEQQGGWRPVIDAAARDGQLERPRIRTGDLLVILGANMLMFVVMWMRRS